MQHAYLQFSGHRLLLALLVLLGSYGRPLTAAAQLAIFNASPSAKPGEAISLQGSFGPTAQIHLSGSGRAEVVPALIQSAGQATIQVPSTFSVGLYQVWVEDAAQRSASVFINQARGMHYDSPEVIPGGTVRLFGRNLSVPNANLQVRFVERDNNQSTIASISPTGLDAYKVVVNVPASLTVNKMYDVYLATGGGGETKVDQPLTVITAGTNPYNLPVAWGHKFISSGNVYNVKTDTRLSVRAIGNGVADDRPAIQEALDRAEANGGGEVYLPAGTYKLMASGWGGLEMRNRVVVRGAGKGQTIIQYGFAGTGQGVHLDNGKTTCGLVNLTLENVSNDGTWDTNMYSEQGIEFILLDVEWKMNIGRRLDIADYNKVCILRCEFTQGNTFATKGYSGTVRLDGSKNVVFANNKLTFATGGLMCNNAKTGACENLVVENNEINRDGSARWTNTSQNTLVNHLATFEFARNVANLNNSYKVINGAPQNINDGEAIIAEGGANAHLDESVGTVVSSTASTLVVDKAWLHPANEITRPVVAIVHGKGMGQWREVTRRDGNTLYLNQDWAVTPDGTSRYATFNWGSRNWLIQGNTFENNRRGITLYHNATTEVAIVGNTLRGSGSIDLTPLQRDDASNTVTVGFYPMYNNQIVGNSVTANTDGTNGAFIGVHTVQYIQPKTYGTSVIGLEMRDNILQAAGRTAVVDAEFPEGYLNYLQYQNDYRNGAAVPYVNEGIPAVLGSILQNNTAINCAKAVYVKTGSYNTLVCNTNLSGGGALLDDQALPGVTQASVRTVTTCAQAPVAGLRTPENPANAVAGLNYHYYEGYWNALPDFTTLTPAKAGTVTSFDLSAATLRTYGYAVHYTGYVTVPADGQYTFTTLSDDGSRLYIGSQLVVDNDGLHGDQERSGTIGLRAGTHVFTVDFLQNGGDQHLAVSYQVPGQSKQLIPDNALRRVSTASTPTAVYRINAGGEALTTSRGAFAADQYAIAGSPYAQNVTISGTADPALYQSERNGTFGYSFPVANGAYTVVLHFAEIYWPQPGQRVFDVAVEGVTRLDNYDIVAKVGPRTATTETLPVTVTDGALDLTFAASVDQAKVSAIEIMSDNSAARPLSAWVAKTNTAGWGVYPNPASDAFTVTYQAAAAGQATLTLTDALGRQVKRQALALRLGLNQLVVPATGLPAGIYQLTLSAPGSVLRSQKVVLQP
ncbi:malectin domain-containing carbohydrate-binding protein [Hymenobacter sp.]|jgi:hypothetical protein|uniref:malectin domain-containing carbohydrate-binding protein n=1 Tax=Hymenobacter sp. TaxID=1898978 RepID=UPI002EDBAE12